MSHTKDYNDMFQIINKNSEKIFVYIAMHHAGPKLSKGKKSELRTYFT